MNARAMKCQACGAPLRGGQDRSELVCEYCGQTAWLDDIPTDQPVAPAPTQAAAPIEYSPSSYIATLVLAIMLGMLGVHRFYTGHVVVGIVQLATGGGMGIWWIVDIIVILAGGFRDSQGRLLKFRETPRY